MVRLLVLMVSVGIALLARSRCGDARVWLSSVRTGILRDGHALPTNRSARGSRMEPTLIQCSSDLECGKGSYCHVPTKSPAHSRCQTCRRRNRRCRRDGMCCPGNQCSSNVCVPDVDCVLPQRGPGPDGDLNPPTEKGQRKRGRGNLKEPSGRVGDPCLRSSDCSGSLCCARHFWTRICKPVLMEGQVCTRQRRKGHQGPELFQRCSCGDGLSCRTLRDPEDQPPSPSLLSAAAGSKFTASSSSSRHSSPRTLSVKQLSSSGSKTRLHVCQKI